MIDHIIYGSPDLQATVDDLARRLGVEPSAGGQHLGRGTRNYLLSLGDGPYLEIIGPDPDQPSPLGPRPFRLDDLRHPALIAWALTAPNIERRVEAARAAGYDPGPVSSMSRRQPDGTVIDWKLTPSSDETSPSPIPFLIDWGQTPHPSRTSNQGVRLLDFRIETPDVEGIKAVLAALGVDSDVEVSPGEGTELKARLQGPAGEMHLS